MGNEQSEILGIEVDEKAIEVCDFWSQHAAYVFHSGNLTNLTVFIGETFINEPLWLFLTPLQKNSKNLMVYRHPCILRYVSSWKKHSKYYLAVEEVLPLSHVVTHLNTLQISIGLYSIAKALYFLHEQAHSSHNNICLASLYVTRDGSWKLGSMEYLSKYNELCGDYLSKTRSYRYSNGIDPDEAKIIEGKHDRKDFIDLYAFGVLACEILKSKNDVFSSKAFIEFCKNNLQNPNILERPNFKAILEHDFFNHDFIKIHCYLVELPLKSDSEKAHFFQDLVQRLKLFDEALVTSLLSGLLLSRLVLLNETAQEKLLPYLLAARSDIDEENPSQILFSENVFKKFICPKLLDIFKVRDAQIRMVLLEHFPNFMHMFTDDELQLHILPELLVGIKDTNDTLVSVTLRTLADLVPILGASTVIGGKRAKLFHDGKPHHIERKPSKNIKPSVDTSLDTPSLNLSSNAALDREVLLPTRTDYLPERPRPDGGEEEKTDDIELPDNEGDLENWDAWETTESARNTAAEKMDNYETCSESEAKLEIIESLSLSDKTVLENKKINYVKNKSIPDICELDIKNQENNKADDVDFFQDMEPVIDVNNKFVVSDIDSNKVGSMLAVKIDDVNEEGWGEEEW